MDDETAVEEITLPQALLRHLCKCSWSDEGAIPATKSDDVILFPPGAFVFGGLKRVTIKGRDEGIR